MFAFRRFDRSTVLFISLLVVSFLVATLDVRAQGGGAVAALRDGAQALFTPLQKATDLVTRPVVGFIDGVSNLAGLRDENDRLRALVQELERRLQDTENLENRVRELELINDLDPPAELTAITARIFAFSPSDFDNIRYIDKGSADGIVKGQAVVDENGLVGRIDSVTVSTARVRLITDPRVSVGVRVFRTNETGWTRGQGGGPLRLEMFRATEPVREGDTLFTDGSRFPPGIPVGTVIDTADAEAGFALITNVAPAIEVSQIDFVKVIIDWSPLDSEPVVDESTVEPPPIVPEGTEGTP